MSGVDSRRWIERAACADYPPDWWFPDDNSPDPERLESVRTVCATCPVRRECLDYAVGYDRVGPPGGHGIWAGFTEGQRSSLRRTVCLGCRRNEDPEALWDRVGPRRVTGTCSACDALARRPAARPPAVPEVVVNTVEWWFRAKAVLTQ